MEELVDPGELAAGAVAEQPAPDDGDRDEGDRHREDEDTAEEALPNGPPVEQQGQHEAYDQRADDEDPRKYDHVADVDGDPLPDRGGLVGELAVVGEADVAEIGPAAVPVAERDAQRPAHEPVHEDAQRD